MDPLSAYQFHVRVGPLEFGFSRVSGLKRERDTFTYQEGGLNDRVHVLPGPAQASGSLHLERGAYFGDYFPFYLTGERLEVPVRVEVWAERPVPCPAKVYLLSGVVVKRWEVGNLDALESKVLIDTFELEYEYLAVVPL